MCIVLTNLIYLNTYILTLCVFPDDFQRVLERFKEVAYIVHDFILVGESIIHLHVNLIFKYFELVVNVRLEFSEKLISRLEIVYSFFFEDGYFSVAIRFFPVSFSFIVKTSSEITR